MTTTTATPASAPTGEVNVFEFRKEARKRTMICPGAGFDFMGRTGLGIACFAINAATLCLAIGTAWAPSQTMLLSTIALVVLGTVLWIYEVFATLSAWPTSQPHRTKLNPWLGAGLIAVLLIVFAVLVMNAFSRTPFVGLHMSPTISDGEEILFHRFVDDERLKRGTVILFALSDENKISEPGKLTLGRIIAVPGDTIAVTKEGRYVVNGEIGRHVSSSGELPIAIRVPQGGKPLSIPPDCYFVAQDSLDEGFDSRVLGYAKRGQIVSTKMFRFSGTPFLETID